MKLSMKKWVWSRGVAQHFADADWQSQIYKFKRWVHLGNRKKAGVVGNGILMNTKGKYTEERREEDLSPKPGSWKIKLANYPLASNVLNLWTERINLQLKASEQKKTPNRGISKWLWWKFLCKLGLLLTPYHCVNSNINLQLLLYAVLLCSEGNRE